jgi:hypothetical protein
MMPTRSSLQRLLTGWLFLASLFCSDSSLFPDKRADAAPADTPAVTTSGRTRTPNSALSVHVLGLPSAGLTAQYERLALRESISVAGLLGVRASAAGDYSSRAFAAGLELRHWFTGRAFRSSLGRTVIGPYVGARIAVLRTTTNQRASAAMSERTVGSSMTVTESIDFGYRFALWRRLEITPSAGLAVRTDLDTHAGLPASTQGSFTVGLTVGWLL